MVSVLYSGMAGDLVIISAGLGRTSAGLEKDVEDTILRGGVLKILSDILVFRRGEALLSGLLEIYLLILVCKALNLIATPL